MRQLFLSAAVVAIFVPSSWAEEKGTDTKQWKHPDVVKGKFFLGFVGEMEKNLKFEGDEKLKTEYKKLKFSNLGLEVGYHSDVKYSFWFSGCVRLKQQDEKSFKYNYTYRTYKDDAGDIASIEEKEAEVTLPKTWFFEPNFSVGYSFRPGIFSIIPHVGIAAKVGFQTVKGGTEKETEKTRIYITPEAFVGIRFSASFFYVSPYYKISAYKSVENSVKVFDRMVGDSVSIRLLEKDENHTLDILTHSFGISIGAEF